MCGLPCRGLENAIGGVSVGVCEMGNEPFREDEVGVSVSNGSYVYV